MSRIREREKEERIKNIKAEYRKSANRAMVKKIVFVVVFALIVTAVTAIAAVRNERTECTRIAVVTDTHVVASSLFTAENYDDYRYSNKMMDISEAIFNTFADELIKEKVATCKVLPTKSRWFGVTYREDKPAVVNAIAKLVAEGEYPEKLF